MTVERTDTPGTFKVYYNVDLTVNPPSCDCRSGCLSDRVCHHIRSAQEFQRGEPVTFWRDK